MRANEHEKLVTLGRAIKGLRREHLVIASKCYFPMSDDPNDCGLSRKHVFESVHGSLRRLELDYLDLYQCHRPDPETPIAEKEHRKASRHAERLRKHRDRLQAKISALDAEQDELLDRLTAS